MATPTSNSTQISFFSEPADSLIASIVDDAKWGGSVGTGLTLSYSFPTANPSFDPDYSDLDEWGANDDSINYFPLNTDQKDAVIAALDTWSNVADITFVETVDDANTVGEIRVALSSVVDTEEASAYAYSLDNFPGAGDIWLSPQVFSISTSLATDTFEFNTLIHEIGHAINLKHPFDPGFSWDTTLPVPLDHILNTVMSYTEDPTGNDYLLSRFPSTPMVLDIEAIQYVYGANQSYNTGDDIYTFHSAQEYLQTLWDAGGTDTILYNGNGDGNIDLREGQASSLGVPVDLIDQNTGLIAGQIDDTVWIAINAEIENATGNNGDNKLFGNDLDNLLIGNDGDDVLKGGAGDDMLSGGNDRDSLVGGSGADDLNGDEGIDKLNGGSGNDTLNGGDGDDVLKGKAGDDVINGDDGDDVLEGHKGTDTLDGGNGNDTYRVHAREDSIDNYADSGADGGTDTLDVARVKDFFLPVSFSAASSGIELISGDNNRLFGSDTAVEWDFSNITLTDIKESRGSSQDDSIIGSSGNDKIKGLAGNDGLSGGAGADKLIGNGGNDSLDGGSGEDRVIGGGDDDVLNGNSGDDFLNGGAGSDTLAGGTGNDTMKGAAGADTFVFDTVLQNSNIDSIIKFVSAEDVIALDDDIFLAMTTLAGNSLSTQEFKANATGIADDADDRIIYNTTSGELFYDANGSGAGAGIKFAQLTDVPTIDADNFIVVA